MIKICRVVIASSVFCIAPTFADVIYVSDGSQIFGLIGELEGDKITISTEFAGDIEVAKEAIVRIESDRPLAIETVDGEVLIGELAADADGELLVVAPSLGTVVVPVENVSAIMDPEVLTAPPDYWSSRVAIGLNGSRGNAEQLNFSGQLSAVRETELDRLELYLRGRYASADGEQTENEIIAGTLVERTFTERWFGFGRLEVETDEFENLDLRATISLGAGYWAIKEDDQFWKLRAGFGYRQEEFDDGTSNGNPILSLGYSYFVQLLETLRFGHDLAYLPTLTEPFDDYRVESRAYFEIPVTDDWQWSVRLGVDNDYNADPAPGNENLDTSFVLNLGYNR